MGCCVACSGLQNVCRIENTYICHFVSAAKGHTSVLQAAVEAVKLGTKESVQDTGDDDRSMKHMRAWSKLLKDCLNQKAGRGETAVMVACEEG